MAKTKAQKKEIISEASDELAKSKALLFADFNGVPVSDLSVLRKSLREISAKMTIVKKRLLNVALKQKGVSFDAQEFAPAQLATIFVSGDFSEAAGPVYRFAKANDKFRILGGFDLEKGVTMTDVEVNAIGQLPPRPVLLAQVLGTMVAPLRAFMYLVQEKGKRSSS
ncbi:MAG: 50S ribosomal protein L10 [Patescibacteria group bacterium]|nr:50S ribosomal protein L10 [Patescibacteria group bacterium]MCL5224438.1 50S ribosomal protein L10 [Patescibacteria group bacterium]